MKRTIVLILAICMNLNVDATHPDVEYLKIQSTLQKGWGTFNHKSVFSHVHLPDGFALNIGIKRRSPGPSTNYLKDAFISSRDFREESIIPGPHALDGSYTQLTVKWQNIEFTIESATSDDGNIFLLVKPISIPILTPSVVLESGILWNQPGNLELKDGNIIFKNKKNKIVVHAIGKQAEEKLANTSPYLALSFDEEIAFYTGKGERSMEYIKNQINKGRQALEQKHNKYDSLANTYQAIESVLGWNIIYDPSQNRVICPVSRLWNENFGGQSILFLWDTYFASWMLSLESKELAYANAIEMTKSITPLGFVPNWSGSYRNGSWDRSQPPVGSLVFKKLYERYHDLWLLEYVFDDLMKWNRWWPENRDDNGYLCWGSNPVMPPYEGDFATNEWQGAAYESGLDNSPMYDNIPFDKTTNMLRLADVGLMSLYIMDCIYLKDIALILGKKSEADELTKRADYYKSTLRTLWDEKSGIFKNKRTDTNEFSEKLSPTNFYPMLAGVPDQSQAERMVQEHLMNPDEFYGKWMIPSISRNDSSFTEQDYWRGRIWAPMNLLVYLGLKNYNLPESQKIIADKSNKLMMDNWNLNGWIYENYDALTGNVTNPEEARTKGDNYYHWGALLGFIQLLYSGF